MLGSGFLRQMNETIKLNRENLKKNKKIPFEKGDPAKQQGSIFLEEKEYSEGYRKELLEKLSSDRKRERMIQVLVLLLFLILVAWVAYSYGPALKRSIIDFLNDASRPALIKPIHS